MHLTYPQKRHQLLQQMARLDTMEHGSLKAEYRPTQPGPAAEGLGPYFKHQVWQDGRNVSRRVPAEQAAALAEAIANRQTFERLARDYIGLTVEHTRHGDAKKNSNRPPRPKGKKPSKT
jgi:hypothetical protein